jgi:hypothetical protein
MTDIRREQIKAFEDQTFAYIVGSEINPGRGRVHVSGIDFYFGSGINIGFAGLAVDIRPKEEHFFIVSRPASLLNWFNKETSSEQKESIVVPVDFLARWAQELPDLIKGPRRVVFYREL